MMYDDDAGRPPHQDTHPADRPVRAGVPLVPPDDRDLIRSGLEHCGPYPSQVRDYLIRTYGRAFSVDEITLVSRQANERQT